MIDQLKEHNYLIVDEFIDETRAFMLYETFKYTTQNSPNLFTKDHQCPSSAAMYNWKGFLELLIESIPLVSKVIGETMFPTYSYSRLYSNGEVLRRHKDRASCEVSITCHLGSDGTSWPIFFKQPNGEEISVDLKPGQAVMYLGCIAEHWRDAFPGNEYGQVFLHYVKSQGSNWHHYFDKLGEGVSHGK